jgi:xanthine dehydrogenase molybdopterin-binding subunit B
MEYIMERLAHELNVDPEEFRMRNVLKKGDRLIKSYGLTLAEDNPLPKMIHELKQSSNYLERKKSVDEFNKVSTFYIYLEYVI